MYFFIEFIPLCQKVWAFLSNFGLFRMSAHQISLCQVTQEANFENVLFYPNSTFNIRKSHKISSGKALYFRSYQAKPHGGGGRGEGGGGTPPVPLGLKQHGHKCGCAQQKHVSWPNQHVCLIIRTLAKECIGHRLQMY